MNSNKLRPQSTNFRKVKKPRVASGYHASPPQDYNRWSTVYREAAKACEKKPQQKAVEPDDLSDLMSVKSVTKPSKQTAKPSNKENLEAPQNGFFVKKAGKRGSQATNNAKPADPHKAEQNSTNKRSELIAGSDVLKSTIKDIINKPANTTNPLGQQEHYLDPADALKCPAHTKVVTNATGQDFLKKNLHSLYKTANEYYPMLGGECLCGSCTCGSCKCVHMKYKSKEESSIGQPLSRADYVNHGTGLRSKPIVRPQETVKLPNEFVKDSLYKTDYAPVGLNSNEPKFMNKAKLDNTGPGSSSIKAPIAQITNNKLDYPDWGYRKVEPIKLQAPAPMTKKLPSTFKTQNQDYGAFFNEEGAEPVQAMVRKVPKRSNNFFGPTLPMNYDSQQRNDFKNPGHVTVEKRLPRDNLFTENEPFPTRFKPVKQDYGDHPKVLTCPLKERIKKVKELIKTYANNNMIPL